MKGGLGLNSEYPRANTANLENQNPRVNWAIGVHIGNVQFETLYNVYIAVFTREF